MKHAPYWSGRCRHCRRRLELVRVVELTELADDEPSVLECPYCAGDVCLEHDGDHASRRSPRRRLELELV
jgi:hypothetical protein